jgi:hypothetical protein
VITILNKGATKDSDIGGWHKYELSIGTQVIVNFEHQRLDGLAKCLRAAADAVEKKQKKRIGLLADKLKIHQQMK